MYNSDDIYCRIKKTLKNDLRLETEYQTGIKMSKKYT